MYLYVFRGINWN